MMFRVDEQYVVRRKKKKKKKAMYISLIWGTKMTSTKVAVAKTSRELQHQRATEYCWKPK